MDSPNHVVQTPSGTPRFQSENADTNTVTAVNYSPVLPNLPSRPNHGHSPSMTRKRTNEQVYEPAQQPKPTPTASRFQKSVSSITAVNVDSPQEGDDLSEADREHGNDHHRQEMVSNPERSLSQGQTETQAPTSVFPQTSDGSFIRGIEEYQQQLELEFQEFERSLTARDKTAGLNDMDWDELERSYSNDIQPKIDAEQEIMNEFNARFQVCSRVMWYMMILTLIFSNSCCTCKYQMTTSRSELSRDYEPVLPLLSMLRVCSLTSKPTVSLAQTLHSNGPC